MDFTTLFDAPQPSSDRKCAASAAKMTAPTMWAIAAPAVIKVCLEHTPSKPAFATRDIFDACPQICELYETPKALGDRLGQGVAGHGLGLHPAPGGGHLRCRENATLAVWAACCPDFIAIRKRLVKGETVDQVMPDVKLQPEAVETLTKELGYESVEALSAAIKSLPAANVLCPA